MPRMPRAGYEGAIDHVTVRMAGRAWETGRGVNPAACLFRDDAERERFIDQLGECLDGYGVRLQACGPMLTHFHSVENAVAATRLSADRSLRHRLADIESALTRESGS